ncbi:MAG: TlpA family protein disulfide reductase [Bacteroidales bacterium]|nr:TlpA family protein disulfide reductase [Bacteroidales bacterium]
MEIKNKFKWVLTTIVLSAMFACTTDPTSYEIVIKGGEHFPEGAEAQISRRRVDSIRKFETIIEESFKDGVIVHKGQVTSPHVVRLDVRSGDGKKMYSGIILMALEPGKTEIDFTSTTEFTFKGGQYSELIVNPVINDPAYQKANQAFHAHRNKGVSAKDEKAMKEYYRLAAETSKPRGKILAKVYQQQKDPLAKLLLHRVGYHSGDGQADMKTQEELISQLEDNREAIIAKKEIEMAKEAYAKRATLEIGKTMKDFKASNLQGEGFQLSEVMKKNKYVLVELWASWCGPCRAEIPHMKRAYEAFHEKGFEIMSFSLDTKRKDWEKASDEEDIPWINTSDLKGYESPIAKKFATPAVPANWLVDASTGEIIALHVRGKALDQKLEELFK